ncbi:MAG TPA: hypothetical protein VJZ73_13390 [Methylomirabilota bacterium]|nr:hypothetical protein [Methylomirabilota bacterium]
MTRLVAAALALALACPVHADAPKGKAPACKRTKWRYIHGERVPWDHDVDDHEWDDFDHSKDECIPPPC